eukprot:7368492-Prymnesium_polylepis.1
MGRNRGGGSRSRSRSSSSSSSGFRMWALCESGRIWATPYQTPERFRFQSGAGWTHAHTARRLETRGVAYVVT